MSEMAIMRSSRSVSSGSVAVLGQQPGELGPPGPGPFQLAVEQRSLGVADVEALRCRDEVGPAPAQHLGRLPAGMAGQVGVPHVGVERGRPDIERLRALEPFPDPALQGVAATVGGVLAGARPAHPQGVRRAADDEEVDRELVRCGSVLDVEELDAHPAAHPGGHGLGHGPGVAPGRLVHHCCVHRGPPPREPSTRSGVRVRSSRYHGRAHAARTEGPKVRRAGSPPAHHSRDNGAVKLYRDEAVVLRTHKLGEADRLITLLTRRHGRVRAVAKGVRRTGSRFGARLEPFTLVDVQLYAGRSLHTVTQVVTIETFAQAISADYGRFTAASAMLETTDRLTDEVVDPNQRGFLMLVGALRAMAEGHLPAPLVLDSFLLRTLAISGWAPELQVCAGCGAPGPHHALDVRAGGLVCTSCRRPGAVAVRQAAVEHMIFLLAGDWENVVPAEATIADEAGRLITDTVTWHLERSVRSLSYVER